MMNTIDRITNELAAGKKISEALSTIYSKRNVSIPCSKSERFEVDVRELGMSNRTTNALLRAKLKTINDIIGYVNLYKITDVRNMGTSCCIEIMEAILDYAWEQMSIEEKVAFLIQTVVKNERYLKA